MVSTSSRARVRFKLNGKVRHRMPAKRRTKGGPPNGQPVYRLLTGPDDAAFCRRVSEALALGYKLHGSPAATFNGKEVIVAQALVWHGAVKPGR